MTRSTTPVNGVRGAGSAAPRGIKIREFLLSLLPRYRFESLRAGGTAIDQRLKNLQAQLAGLPPNIRSRLVLPIREIALSPLDGRGHLVRALVRELGFVESPKMVIELYGGANFAGAMALPDTAYVQVANEKLIAGLGSMPKNFLEYMGLGELSDKELQIFLERCSKRGQAAYKRTMEFALPNLKLFQEDVADFVRRPAFADRADLCFAVCWQNKPSHDMELVVRPGGFMVTIDIPEVAALTNEATELGARELEHPTGSVYRADLSTKFERMLRRTPGYKELGISVIVYQKKET